MANQSVASGILTDYNGNPFLPRTTFSQVFKDDTGISLVNYVWPVENGGTGKASLDSGKALIGNGTNAVSLRSITNNTTATAVAASTNLITANTLYYHKGNSNIVTVGTITSGTWQGTDVGLAYGGTGVSLSNNPSMLVNLESTTAGAVFANSPRPGVTGTLAIGNGGTGITSNPSMLVNLGSTTADTVFEATPRPGVTGTLPIANGGTGATTAEQARVNLGILSADDTYQYSTPRAANTVLAGPTSGDPASATFRKLVAADIPVLTTSHLPSVPDTKLPIVPISKGGTGATTAAAALINLGLTATATELNYVDGVTSAIQTQLNGKQATITGAASSIVSDNFSNKNCIIRSDNNGKAQSTTNYISNSKLAINSSAEPSANFYVNGTGHFKGALTAVGGLTIGTQLILNSAIYGSLDDMNAITNPVEGQVFFVLN